MKESLRVGEGAEGAVRSKYANKPPGFSDTGGFAALRRLHGRRSLYDDLPVGFGVEEAAEVIHVIRTHLDHPCLAEGR